MKYKVLFKGVHGSHLYGLNTEKSDKDYKGVFMPDVTELLLGKSPKQIHESTGNNKTKNTPEDVDTDWYSLPEFIHLAVQGETIALDMLHTTPEFTLETSKEWEFIHFNRDKFYTKDMKALVGYARKQAAKYGVKGSRMAALEEVYNITSKISLTRVDKLSSIWDKLPLNEYCKFVVSELKTGEIQTFYEVLGSKYQNSMSLYQFITAIETKWGQYGERARQAKENEGIDWKVVSHAIRAACQLKEIYEHGTITYPLKDREMILAIKKGEKDFLTYVQPMLESLISEVEYLADTSSYPNKVDVSFWEKWLIATYMKEIK